MERRKFLAPEFIIGSNSIELIDRYSNNLDAKKVMIVSDEGVVKAGWVDRVERKLKKAKIKCAVFSSVTPNPKDTEVMEGAEFYRNEKCDLIVSVGGGSPMDCAKGIGIVLSDNDNILAFEGVDKIKIPPPPLICIPTTAGTGSEVSQFSIINAVNRKVKIAIISKTIVPDVGLVDPETTLTMPPELTAATGMDALVHSVEAYVSNASSPITDLHALKSIELVAENLVKSVKTNKRMYRDNMMLASLLAGLAFSNASLGLVHSMAHSLGGYFNLAHGECNALLLEAVIDFNFDAEPERFYKILELLTKKKISPKDNVKSILIETLHNMRREIGMDYSLSSLGLKKSDVPTLAEKAMNDPCHATNPKTVSYKDIVSCYEKAF